MGNDTSTLAGAAPGDAAEDGGEHCGFRVLGIQERSPAAAAGFVSFFDFILSANGIRLDSRDSTLMELIAQSEGRALALDVYNVKSQTTRELHLTPSREWPGKGLLGVTIRFDTYEGAEDQVLHVLQVESESPAERAGLRAGSDYLLGTPDRVFRDADDLHDEILDALDGSFQCYVYNSEDDQVRIVSIVPTERWGGDGVLGAEVAHGYLHRLPTESRGTVGSSVGFVKLPLDALAATDAFIKPLASQPPQPPSDAAPSAATESESVSGTGDMAGPVADQATAASADTPIEPVIVPDQPHEADSKDTPNSSAEVAVPSIETNSTTAEAVATSAAAVPPPNPSPPKLRYTARTDLQFPISTFEVIAEP